MNTCPICDVEPAQGKLLVHCWQHLPLDHATTITGAKRTPTQTRVCWCGRQYYAFVYWMEHMANKDVQGHYAASLLGITK